MKKIIVARGGSIDPVFDKEVIDTEAQLKDLESIERNSNLRRSLSQVMRKQEKNLKLLLSSNTALNRRKKMPDRGHREERT